MMAQEQIHSTPAALSAKQKAALITDALQRLRAAHGLDEQDSLIDVAELIAWYDRTIPDVKDIKILAAAMEIELQRRRGEIVKSEGEQRGGDVKVEHCSTLSQAERDQRYVARTIAAEPDAVTAYVQGEAKAGRVPSKRGALRAVKAAQATRTPTPQKIPTNVKGGGTCPICGGTRPRGQGCTQCRDRQFLEIGERRLRERDADYAAAVLEILQEPARSEFLRSVAYTNKPGNSAQLPAPSTLFPTINVHLSDRIIREGHSRDIALCRLLAAVPSNEQREFYERWVVNPEQAKRWIALPRWKRPMMAGDEDDHMIWKLFTMIRLRLTGMAAGGRPIALAGLGRSLVQEMGFFTAIQDRTRLNQVLCTYGSMLAHGQDVGSYEDLSIPPWQNPTK